MGPAARTRPADYARILRDAIRFWIGKRCRCSPACGAIRWEPPCGAPRSGLPPASAAMARSCHRPGGALVTGRAELKPPAPGTLLEGGHDR